MAKPADSTANISQPLRRDKIERPELPVVKFCKAWFRESSFRAGK
jgi:hypothetical protein